MSRTTVFRNSPVLTAVAAAAALALAVFGTGAVSSAAASEPGSSAAATTDARTVSRPVPVPRDIPAALQVPAGYRASAVLLGKGVQVYTCTSGAWTLLEPAATLYSGEKAVGLHSRGPEWISTVDGSAVNATAVASVSQPTAVAELLLKATANRGTGTFGKVGYVQRLDTKGGLASAGTCTSTGQLAVPYSATYVFYTPTA